MSWGDYAKRYLNNMNLKSGTMDIKVIIEAATKLNDTWTKCSKNIEKEDVSADIYNCACEIDEAVIALVEKIGNCAKAIAISNMYGKSPLAESHKTIVARDVM